MSQVIVSTFYKFQKISDTKILKCSLAQFCFQHNLKGTILIAEEGVNATISGQKADLDLFYKNLEKKHGIKLENIKESVSQFVPFEKMKVKIKDEIVKMGIKEVDGANPGIYVKPEKWDDFIQQDDVVLVDTRNTYEINEGTFEKAINPNTKAFRDFPQWFLDNLDKFEGKKIAMCCTGGVRCEKSTAYVKTLGFEQVYHLEGGILNYLKKLGSDGKTWKGSCFVFDERVLVNEADA